MPVGTRELSIDLTGNADLVLAIYGMLNNSYLSVEKLAGRKKVSIHEIIMDSLKKLIIITGTIKPKKKSWVDIFRKFVGVSLPDSTVFFC